MISKNYLTYYIRYWANDCSYFIIGLLYECLLLVSKVLLLKTTRGDCFFPRCRLEMKNKTEREKLYKSYALLDKMYVIIAVSVDDKRRRRCCFGHVIVTPHELVLLCAPGLFTLIKLHSTLSPDHGNKSTSP